MRYIKTVILKIMNTLKKIFLRRKRRKLLGLKGNVDWAGNLNYSREGRTIDLKE